MNKNNNIGVFLLLGFLSSVSIYGSYGQNSYGQYYYAQPSYGQASYAQPMVRYVPGTEPIKDSSTEAIFIDEKKDIVEEAKDLQEEQILVAEIKNPAKKAKSEAQLKKIQKRRDQRKIANQKRKEVARNKSAQTIKNQVVPVQNIPIESKNVNTIPVAPPLPAQNLATAVPSKQEADLPVVSQGSARKNLLAEIQTGKNLRKTTEEKSEIVLNNQINISKVIPAAPPLPVQALGNEIATKQSNSATVAPVVSANKSLSRNDHLEAIRSGVRLHKPKELKPDTSPAGLLKARLERNRSFIE